MTSTLASAKRNRLPRIIAFAMVLLLMLGATFLLSLWHHRAARSIALAVPRDAVEDAEPTSASTESPSPATGTLVVSADKPGFPISPTLYGLALEEINHSLDAGLYAQLLPNRDLSQYHATVMRDIPYLAPDYWSLLSFDPHPEAMMLDRDSPIPGTSCTSSIRLDLTGSESTRSVAIANRGYAGIPVTPNTSYHASFYAKAGNGFSGSLDVSIQSSREATTFAHAATAALTTSWQRYEVDLTASSAAAPSLSNQFVISTQGAGTLWIGSVSLFPPTFHDRPNGNRIDLMEKLADLQPGYIVFPGGDSLLGPTLSTRFAWKKTIGPSETRASQPSTWHRTSNGFGLMEFLLTCEDFHAQPVLAIYSGSSMRQRVAPGEALVPYVEDALDEIEYVTGDATTPWGARRAADGHRDPFPLLAVQIGNNEQIYGKDTYDARFTQFYDAIKAKYPKLTIIGWMDLATTRTPDISHESFYSPPHDLLSDPAHYDAYERGTLKFASEFNAKEGDPTKPFGAALADMSWMLGVQRNADAVVMAAAAPLFINIDPGASQHPANLIGYNGLSSFSSPSYYALRMFNQNRGDTTIPFQLSMPEEHVPSAAGHGAIGVGTWNSAAEFKDIKVTTPDGTVLLENGSSPDVWRLGDGTWKVDHGTLQQTSLLTGCTAVAGDPAWTDYVLTLKARKLLGSEGFLILVHVGDAGNHVWWNIGGWNNSRTGLEQTLDGQKISLGDLLPQRIETDRWYDLRVEVQGGEIICSLDDVPVLTAKEHPALRPTAPMFAAASRDVATGTLILKVVNVLPRPSLLDIDLAGVSSISENATLELMAANPGDVNTIDTPEKVTPRKTRLHVPAPRFAHLFPPHSISILRLNPAPAH